MALSEREEVVHRIRLLSAIELAASELLGPEVIRANRLGLTWKEIGRAAGFSDSRAHRRWSEIVKGERSGPRSRSRSFAMLLRNMTPNDLSLMPEVLGELGKYLRSPTPTNQFAEIIRHQLTHDLKQSFVERAKDRTTVFIMASSDTQLRCVEPDPSDGEQILTVSLHRLFDSAELQKIEMLLDEHLDGTVRELRSYLTAWLSALSR